MVHIAANLLQPSEILKSAIIFKEKLTCALNAIAMGTAKIVLTIQIINIITFVRDLEAWLFKGYMMALYLSTAMAVSVKILAFTLRF